MWKADMYFTGIKNLSNRIANARALTNITYNALVNDDTQINKNYERMLEMLEILLFDIEEEHKSLTGSLKKMLDTWKEEIQ